MTKREIKELRLINKMYRQTIDLIIADSDKVNLIKFVDCTTCDGTGYHIQNINYDKEN